MGAFGWGAPRLVPDRRSAAGPSLGMVGDDYFMAWTGAWYEPGGFAPVAHDTTIWWSGFDRVRNDWQPQQPFAEFRSSVAPALSTTPSGELAMAWSDYDQEVPFWSAFVNGRWRTGRAVGSPGLVLTSPAVARFGTLFMAWGGGGPGLWWTSFNPVQGTWFTPQRLADRGTSHAPALAGASAGDPLVMAWKGLGGDTAIWWSTFDGSAWGPQQAFTDRQTAAAPALGTVGGSIAMAWTWDGALNTSLYLGGQWTPPRVLPGARTALSPALPN
ncbi:hypothetical protein I7331_39155 [Frankia sp. AgB1.8]|nr:hypothetical protein [Frankia sp. AgB1.8]